ncbi:MAG TPA: amidohydrolase family protein [Burkholderiales bacterium]|nr:amidohydrolase family protein [Burkholderiales bacterium]
MRTLIRNAAVIRPEALGASDRLDVLIQNGKIVEVGSSIECSDVEEVDATGMILAPGFVNAHVHLWEFLLRGIGADWVSKRDYHGTVHGNLAEHVSAEDVYAATLAGALNQINSGTTTVLDWCHVVRDEQMVDAALDALRDSGIRAVFARGTAKPPTRDGEAPYWTKPFPRAAIHRLRTQRLASDEALVTPAMAVLGTDIAPYEVARQDAQLAREYDVLQTCHLWARPGQRRTPDGLARLHADGLLGPDFNIAHGNCLPDDELQLVVDAGGSLTSTSFAEMLNSVCPPVIGRVSRLGGMPSLGTDVCAYFNSSMLLELRNAFKHQREDDNRALHQRNSWPAEYHWTRTREAFAWATIGGAKALRLDSVIGSIAPGKAADLILVNAGSLNIFPAAESGDLVHSLVMYAETADIDSVMINGHFHKRGGQLQVGTARLRRVLNEVAERRGALMARGDYVYRPFSRGPMP